MKYSLIFLSFIASCLAQESSSTSSSTVDICQGGVLANNTWGDCSCKDQLFVSDDCKRAFYCLEDQSQVGCEIICKEGEELIVDPRYGVWMCRPRLGPMPLLCPGGFNTECSCSGSDEECPMAECECDGQISVNNDCTVARRCDSSLEQGYEDFVCDGENEIVYVDLTNYNMFCGNDDGRCPGAFHVGCHKETTVSTFTPPPSTTTVFGNGCVFKDNDLGECGCDKQLFVDEDCQKAFYCMDPEDIPDGETGEGCELQCAEDEILIADPRYGDGYWYCLKNTGVRPIKCPGEFRTECGCSGSDAECPIGECHCEGEILVNSDCTEVRRCNSSVPDLGYESITCEDEDDIVMVNLRTLSVYCEKDDGRCPGAFHVGCDDHDHDSTSASSDSSTTSTTSEPDNGSSLTFPSFILLICTFIFTLKNIKM